MWRIGMMILGLSALALGGVGVYVMLSGDGILHKVMEGTRATIFAAAGVCFVIFAFASNETNAKFFVRDFIRDVFSRRNLTEFALFWTVVGLALAALLILR